MPAGTPKQLPSPRMAPDTVVLEVAFIQLPNDAAGEDELWRQIDEQHWPAEVRRRLSDNGLRIGLLGTQMPDTLRSLLDVRAGVVDLLSQGGFPEQHGLPTFQQRLQVRGGQERKIRITQEALEEMVIVLNEDGAVRARRFEKPQGLLNLCLHPLGDGRVRLELSPEIEYGETRQRWVGGQGQFAQISDRQRCTFDKLRVTTTMAPGQTLIVTATSEAKGLGGHFFAALASDHPTRSAMLVRIAQTQLDDLFAPPPQGASPAPPAD